MKLVCENCQATYDVADNAIPPEGREVQCARCDHVWLQQPPSALVEQPQDTPVTDEAETAAEATTEVEADVAEAFEAFASADTASEETSAENDDFNEIEATEFHSYRAETLPDASGVSPKFDADVLEAEAEFARSQRGDELQTEEDPEASPLEALRRRVITDTPAVPDMPTDAELADDFETVEETAFVDNTPETENPAELNAPLAEAEDIVFTPEPMAEDAPEPEPVDVVMAEPEMPAETVAEAPKAVGGGFRKLGGAKRSDPPLASPTNENPDDGEMAIAEVETAEAPPPPGPVKRRRQSLAEISSGGFTPSEPREPPASKPFDLGPAAPEERPETPVKDEAPRRPVEMPPSEPIAKPDMSPEAIARRAMEELEAVEVREEKASRSLAGGFAIGLLIIVLMIFLYSFGPVIAEAAPQTAPYINVYVDGFDSVFALVGIDLSHVSETITAWLEAI
ncbi:MAG: zinc-ribbon domain-containing protein [Pseudomonadota bacterium]